MRRRRRTLLGHRSGGAGISTEEETRLAPAMVDHRNLTSHTYNEPLADQIFAMLPQYAGLMRRWLERLAA